MYHVISRQITPKQQANTISTKPRGLLVEYHFDVVEIVDIVYYHILVQQ